MIEKGVCVILYSMDEEVGLVLSVNDKEELGVWRVGGVF